MQFTHQRCFFLPIFKPPSHTELWELSKYSQGRFIWKISFQKLLYFPSFKRWNCHISAPGPQIKKLRTLSFLQLLKFEIVKYPYFFNLWPRGRDIGLFSLDNGTNSSSSKSDFLEEKCYVEEHQGVVIYIFFNTWIRWAQIFVGKQL